MRFILLFLLGLLIGCRSRTDQNQSTATPASTTSAGRARTVCYERIEGRDTTSARLVINGAAVTGTLSLRPYEKDYATGPLRGTLTGDQLRADWQRAGEGVTQTYVMAFTLTDKTLRWRDGERVEERGKWVLKTPTAGYEYVLNQTPCR